MAFDSLEGAILPEGNMFGITVEPSFGFLYGQSREIVFDTGDESTQGMSSSNGYYLSELIWDITDVLYTGMSASLNFQNRVYVNFGIWKAVTDGSGYMNDYDWVLQDKYGAYNILHDRDGKTDLSHWSLSTVDIVNSVLIDANGSYDFLENPNWSLLSVMGYKYLFWDWTDSIIDSEYDGIEDVIEVGTNGIDYRLALHIPYIGLRGGYRSRYGFFLKANIGYSPFVFGMDHDHHILRGLHFYDRTYFGQYLSGTLEAGIQLSPLFSLKFLISGEYLFESKGITYAYYDSGTPAGTFPGGAGIQYQSLSLSLNAAFSF
ncbi:omptin family outer membrane protease [Spirochaeta isovalerica]|uniref:Outer membrane protease n=1 Tax=Spirochaeta isovalerica TaxID=150 RepID=A0A841RIB4_9SPIO|nr:omptin family outer membrane protease [Spirochaeta isovalerica]MBB6482489.1 outer membrane protease [Spirochaeta isovalerica]